MMSVGPTGFVGSVAGLPLAQTRGAEADRAAQETAQRDRAQHSAAQAEQAAGIGATDGEEHAPQERDADGRRPWELPADKRPDSGADPAAESLPPTGAKDPSGVAGSQLDLSA